MKEEIDAYITKAWFPGNNMIQEKKLLSVPVC